MPYAPVAVFALVPLPLAGQSPHHFLRAFAVDADTNQGAIARIHCPVTCVAVSLDGHRVYSLRLWGRACTLPQVDVTRLCTSAHQ